MVAAGAQVALWEVAAVVPTAEEREKATVVEVSMSAESGKEMVSVAVAA